MLILSRRPADEIIIGPVTVPGSTDTAVVTLRVIEVYADGRVRIGIDCDRRIAVDRMEVRRARERDAANAQAKETPP